MTTWLFIGPSLLAGIGQVTKRYADLVDGEYVEIGHPPKKSRYDRGFAFVLPIENQLVAVDQYAQICTEMMYMTVCETEPVNPAYGLLSRYKTIWCPSEFAQSTLSKQFPKTEWKLLRHWAPEKPIKFPEATTRGFSGRSPRTFLIRSTLMIRIDSYLLRSTQRRPAMSEWNSQ